MKKLISRKFILDEKTIYFTPADNNEVLVTEFVSGKEMDYDVIWECQAQRYMKKLIEKGAIDVDGAYYGEPDTSVCAKCICSDCSHSQRNLAIPIA